MYVIYFYKLPIMLIFFRELVDVDNYKCLKPLSTEPNVWLPELKLSQSDQEVLLCPTGWLTDNIMNAAQHLLQNQFPNVEG